MKKMAWVTGLLACVMVVLTALGSVCNAVWQIAIDESFYSEQSRAAVKTAMGFATEEEVTAYIGLTPEEQAHFAWTAREHMLGEDESIDFPHYISHDESRHMIDVRNLVWSARDTGKICLMLAAVLAVMIAWTGAKIKRRSLALLGGTISGAALTAAIAAGAACMLRSSGFTRAFTKMHELLFDNDLWLMDPAEDILIRMMPQPLFEQALLSGAGMALRMTMIATVLLLVICAVVGAMIRRNLTKEDA